MREAPDTEAPGGRSQGVLGLGGVLLTDWLEISVPLTGEPTGGDMAAEDVAALLVVRVPDAFAGVELRPGEIVFWVPRERAAAAVLATRQVVAGLAAAGGPLDPARVESRAAAPEAEWRDAWKRTFRTCRLTRQIVVVPSWDSHDARPEDRVVHLDPGQAFGTGAHASTRLVLSIMQDLADRAAHPQRVLDLGTGSGILALAASALWPHAEVLALDTDPLAVAAARENVAANRAEGRVQVTGTDLRALAEESRRFDLALANIQADVLSELCGAIVGRVAPGGWAVLSGLLSEQAQPIADQYCRRGMALEAVRAAEDDPSWSAVLLRCSAC